MKCLLDGKLAPLTFAWGFLEASPPTVGDALYNWTSSHCSQVSSLSVKSTLHDALLRLQPLSIPPRNKLLLQTRSSWTAYFDNGAHGGDPASAVGYLAEHLRCRGIAVTCVPQTLRSEQKDAKGTYGAVQFELFAPERREFLNYERSISAANDGGKWVFSATGAIQPYERPEQYKAKRVKDRFTAEMLEEYCLALGIRLFDSKFYGPDGWLVKVFDPLPPGHPVITLAEARERLGLTPSRVH